MSKWSNKIICFVIIYVLMLILYKNGKMVQYEYQMQGYTEILCDEVEYQGYNIIDDFFIPIDEFSCLWIKLAGSNVASFQVNFLHPLTEEIETIAYYSNQEGNLDELHSIYKTIPEGGNSTIVDLPEDSISYVAFIIKGEFSLENILVSDCHAQKIIINRGRRHIFSFLIFDAIISYLVAFLFFKITASNRCKTVKLVKEKKYTSVKVYFVVLMAGVIVLSSKWIRNIDGDYIVNYYRLFFFISVCTTILIMYELRDMADKYPEYIFLVISLMTGFIYALSLPMLVETTWDAAIHYRRTTELSHIFDGAYSSLDVGHLNYSYKLQELKILNCKYNKLYESSSLVNVNINWSNIYQYVGYIPNAFLMFVCRGVGVSFVNTIQISKLGNVIVYSIIIFYAIKKRMLVK